MCSHERIPESLVVHTIIFQTQTPLYGTSYCIHEPTEQPDYQRNPLETPIPQTIQPFQFEKSRDGLPIPPEPPPTLQDSSTQDIDSAEEFVDPQVSGPNPIPDLIVDLIAPD